MKKSYQLIDNRLVPVEQKTALIEAYLNPDAQERSDIVSQLGIDHHSLASALDPDEISRVELRPNHTFIIWKHPDTFSLDKEIYFNICSIGMMLMSNKLVLILAKEIPFFEEKFRHPAESRLGIVLNLFSQTAHHFLEHLRVIRMASRDIQNKINTALGNEQLIQLFALGESLTYYLNALSSNGVMLTKILHNAEKLSLTMEETELLEDIIIENDQCAKQAEIYDNVLSGLMDARGSLVNNNMNQILKNLTVINTVFLPLTLIASLGGMSEYSRFTSRLDWKLAYAILLAVMLLIGWVTTIIIEHMGRHSKLFHRKEK